MGTYESQVKGSNEFDSLNVVCLESGTIGLLLVVGLMLPPWLSLHAPSPNLPAGRFDETGSDRLADAVESSRGNPEFASSVERNPRLGN